MRCFVVVRDKEIFKEYLYQKGGHKMMKKFYAGEKWQEWLFDQKR